MKTIKDKQILVGADFAGFPLKEAVVAHLKRRAGPSRTSASARAMKRIPTSCSTAWPARRRDDLRGRV